MTRTRKHHNNKGLRTMRRGNNINRLKRLKKELIPMKAQKTETAKTEGDFYFDDNSDYLARYHNGVVYYRKRLRGKPLTGDQVAEVNLWAVKMKADILHKVDDSDFEAHGAGGEKLLKETMKDVMSFDAQSEIDRIKADIAKNAFGFCKEAVTLLCKIAWREHFLAKHKISLMEECDRLYCFDVRRLLTRMDKELFHGTMADITGIDPIKPVVGEG